ncbi:hypothetical protein FGG78_16840 [Thioclava sp. BHET1]|uniref:Lipoprotein n=1 Tax=Thioclava dalianensis TaxID=1185766 RepID=A0A074TH44_9RHOB|nr:hypothetical protein [Thioclava dalianensis]KEP69470.1 hypothetical protein DL1_03520 [Thioclava dalianensis]TMV88516.1 hypothetical protein FGG78_16840 [Thioclava sp. BHET1]SFN68856.1 hypothetical protein SAMN05216224_10975 [Thioclava dalianensis]
MRFAPAYALVAAGLSLAACAPVPVSLAERQCYTQFAPVRPLSGDARIGVSSDGGFESRTRVNVNLGANVQGDPSANYDACVYRKSGRMPSRPFYSY